ncbi:hypothetical protein LWI28_018132 [Acer negundo]|uniref:EF-hand domain-containing protein n=1 Tax=Acer negundo TaxID=4023 RepID=A0AAD5JAH8_ACENE|nr:hypothetical protein LWI28_018132 [Acer negundo]KAK4854519.1 hypothetical protein QYF36_025233 [Acer negundo]
MVISVLLLAVLFVAGFINIFFYFPTKKVYVKIQSFFSTTPNSTAVAAPSTSSTTTTTAQVSSHRGRSISTNSSNKTVELKRVFATFDKNGDGFITKQELRESLKNLRLMVTEKEAEEMVVKVDANGDGLIDFDEFRILYKAMIAQDYDDDDDDDRSVDGGEQVGDGGEEDLKDAFDVFDKDKDGLISVEELGLVLSSLGLNEGTKIENCREMIRKVDMDGDGMVNFDEFKKMMKSGGKLLTAS